MDHPSDTGLRIGSWDVNPVAGHIARDTEVVRIEARTLRLLQYLAERAGQTVSIDDLLNHVWTGVVVTPDSVYQAVASLRRLLGDDPKRPTYIVTVPRLGYRLVATVSRPAAPAPSPQVSPTLEAPAMSSRPRVIASVVGLTALIAVLVTALLLGRGPATPATSIAVMPFLDLSESMDQEPLADGMTETLIARLSRLPMLHLPAPRDSFYWQGRGPTLTEVARALHVAHVLDGSVRKSGSSVEINTQLIRADTGFIVWSRTYRDSSERLGLIQDDIVAEVAKALGAGSPAPDRS